ncbi:MAG TPA: hypothetical protein PK129_17230, partial [Cellvibrionaceae bacterium]|nr:hypothetical protein [Cellvibrionaceae bacterium]
LPKELGAEYPYIYTSVLLFLFNNVRALHSGSEVSLLQLVVSGKRYENSAQRIPAVGDNKALIIKKPKDPSEKCRRRAWLGEFGKKSRVYTQ